MINFSGMLRMSFLKFPVFKVFKRAIVLVMNYIKISEMLNERFHWNDEDELPEVVGLRSLQSGYSSDELCQVSEMLNEQFQWNEEDELPEVVGLLRSLQNGYSSSDEFYQDFEILNEQFFWDDDSNPSEVDRKAKEEFYKVRELLEELSNADDDCKQYEDEVFHFRTIAGTIDVLLDSSSKSTNIGPVFGPCDGIDDEFSINDNGEILDGVNKINDMLHRLTCVVEEPENKEENLYLRCRKDAIKMDSAAQRHANKAVKSCLRGDQISVKKYLEKIKKEKEAARRLHAEAAREILSIKNKNNGITKLDLHCLHVAEAIQAVKERLHKIETQGSLIYTDEQASGNVNQLLEVITGRGKHSSGPPKLPGAVRSFLKKNGYNFDGSRPGVILVQPKVTCQRVED